MFAPVVKVRLIPLAIDDAPYARSLTTDSILIGVMLADLLLALRDLIANMVRVLGGKSDLFQPIPWVSSTRCCVDFRENA